MVTHLLDVTRLESGTFPLIHAELDLRAEVAEALTQQASTARERGIVLVGTLGTTPVNVTGDPRCLDTIMASLLGNALAFTPPGGRVEVGLTRNEQEARVTVRDTGKGIPAKELPRIWEKFYQVDPSSTREHGGAGLGLAIAKAMVQALGGQIGAESEPGRGSTFWFTLPA
jgi:signal transduction histidine kinase